MNNGAITLSGSSKSTLSFADTFCDGAGLIHERKVRHGKTTRPRFKAGSTMSTGKATFAFIRFDWAISWSNGSGQFSDNAASGTARLI